MVAFGKKDIELNRFGIWTCVVAFMVPFSQVISKNCVQLNLVN